MNSAFYKSVTSQFTDAGLALLRVSKKGGSHDIYRGLDGRKIVVPHKLDDPILAKRLLRIAKMPHVVL